MKHPQQEIRPECLTLPDVWAPPTGAEIREVLRRARLTGGGAARALALGKGGDRTVRRWIGEESHIPYAAWAILCDLAGMGIIWRVECQSDRIRSD